MYYFHFLITFDNGDSYVLRIKTKYVDREAARCRAKQVAGSKFRKRQDKYTFEVLTLTNLLRRLSFDDYLVQLTVGE